MQEYLRNSELGVGGNVLHQNLKCSMELQKRVHHTPGVRTKRQINGAELRSEIESKVCGSSASPNLSQSFPNF